MGSDHNGRSTVSSHGFPAHIKRWKTFLKTLIHRMIENTKRITTVTMIEWGWASTLPQLISRAISAIPMPYHCHTCAPAMPTNASPIEPIDANPNHSECTKQVKRVEEKPNKCQTIFAGFGFASIFALINCHFGYHRNNSIIMPYLVRHSSRVVCHRLRGALDCEQIPRDC